MFSLIELNEQIPILKDIVNKAKGKRKIALYNLLSTLESLKNSIENCTI